MDNFNAHPLLFNDKEVSQLHYSGKWSFNEFCNLSAQRYNNCRVDAIETKGLVTSLQSQVNCLTNDLTEVKEKLTMVQEQLLLSNHLNKQMLEMMQANHQSSLVNNGKASIEPDLSTLTNFDTSSNKRKDIVNNLDEIVVKKKVSKCVI